MLPEPPEITRCHACQNYYWVDQAHQVGELTSPFARRQDSQPIEARWESASHIEELDESEYWGALQTEVAEGPKEERLRLLAWWRSNDSFREPSPIAETKRSVASIHNMELLVEMIEDLTPKSKMMKAELLRELGRFDECIILLATIGEEDVRAARDKILELAHARSGHLAVLKHA